MADILKVNINGTVYNIGKSYGTGNATTLGLTKLYTSTGTSTDGTMTRNAITIALNGKANTSSIPNVSDAFTYKTATSSSFTLTSSNPSYNAKISPPAVSGYTFLCPICCNVPNSFLNLTISSYTPGNSGGVSVWCTMVGDETGGVSVTNIKITVYLLYIKNILA